MALALTGTMLVMDLQASTGAGTSVPATIDSSPADWASPLPDTEGGVWAVDGTSSDAPTEAKGNESSDRKVRVVVLGKDHSVTTDADTVRQLLSAMGIEPDANDRVTPPPSTPLRKVNAIRVTNVTYDRYKVTHKIEPKTELVVTAKLRPGQTHIADQGHPGVMVQTYQREYHDGDRVGQPTLIHETVKREAQPRVKEVGAEPDQPAVVDDGSQGGGKDDGSNGGDLLETGVATWYRVDGNNFTAASLTLKLGTKVVVTNTANGKSVTVLINDHGPYAGATIDLSDNAFAAIGPLGAGHINVRIEKAHGDSSINN